jgi:DNA-binding NtrC family response regulator
MVSTAPLPIPTSSAPISDGLGSGPHTFLFVIQLGSSSIFPVPDDGEVEIGSAKAATLRIGDPGVAPYHARLSSVSGEVTLVPVDGAGPTLVNSDHLERARALVAGDAIVIGETTLVLHRGGKRATRIVLDRDALRHRLREETERSLRYGRPLAVICIDLGETRSLTRPEIVRAVDRELRLTDVVGWDGASDLFAVLPETGDSACTPCSRLLAALSTFAPSARAGVVTCPADACDADTLIAGARHAAASAKPGETARVSDATHRFDLSGHSVVVVDPVMIRLFSLVERLARSDLPVLITGESGVGKESVASALHVWSGRSSKRFVSINCAAIPETLFESELFGHEKGSFSGAASAKAGLFEAADGGTLFLDEVGECPAAQQTKLLRVLETQRLMRLGAVSDHAVDVRVVAATNRSLEGEVASGRFRKDLYYRLSAATVFVPPLRQRALDLHVLARAFLERACTRMGRPTPQLSPSAMVRLARHSWPGNLRELKNTLEYVAATSDGPRVEASDLPTQQLGTLPSWLAAASGVRTESPSTPATPAPTPSPPSQGQFRNLYEEIRELERVRMVEALTATEGARAQAAELIGMPLRTFVTKLKEHAIHVPPKRGDRGPKRR